MIRWLFSTVSISMVIDDHDMHDDWNISRSWLEEMSEQPWWHERVVGGLMSLLDLPVHRQPLAAASSTRTSSTDGSRGRDDAGPALRDFVRQGRTRSGRGSAGASTATSARRRLIVSTPASGGCWRRTGARSSTTRSGSGSSSDKARGDFDHLLIGTSDPYLLAPGLHYLEAWNEAVCNGAWGGGAARIGERMRRELDFDHWAAFQRSFARLTVLLREIGAGRHGRPRPRSASSPATSTTRTSPRSRSGPTRDVSSAVYQAVCSPFRNALDANERRAVRLGHVRPMEALLRGLAHAAGVEDPDIRWRFAGGPYFDNQIATLSLKGREASLTISKTVSDPETEGPKLETAFERRIA